MLTNLEATDKIVDYFHLLFLADNIGFKSLPEKDRKTLKENGYINTVKKNDDLLTLAYKFGKLTGNTESRGFLNKMNYGLFSKVASKEMKLTVEDRFVISNLKASFYNDVKRANNRVKDDINSEILRLNKDRRYYIRKKLKRKFTESDLKPNITLLNDLSKYLAGKQKDWNNHFDLITSYNFHAATMQGFSTSTFEKYGDDVEVTYSVHEDACKSCKDVYLYPNGAQRSFKLLDIVRNGDNIGRKKINFLASLSPIHPRCRCFPNIKTRKNAKI